jgi:hypothetical protein
LAKDPEGAPLGLGVVEGAVFSLVGYLVDQWFSSSGEREWTYGLLANHLWSSAGQGNTTDVNATFLQPFVSSTTKRLTTFGPTPSVSATAPVVSGPCR